MPKGPQGQKRPADVIGNAILIGKIATGDAQESPTLTTAAELGKKGGKARAKKLTPKRRSEIAKAAADARYGKR